MARGGGRRTYTRDSRGRFASTPGGGLGAARKAARSQSGRASTLEARSSLKTSRAKLRAKDPADQRLSTALSARAQKGAVTRGNRGLKAAKVAAQTRIAGGRKGVIGKTRKAPKLVDANPLKQVRRNRKRGPMTERLRVALEVSSKIASKKQVTANKASKELADRRFISRFILAKSGKAAKLAGSKKEDAARARSAQATKSWQKAEKRADTLLEAYRNRLAAIKKAAPGKLRPGQTKALTRKNPSVVTGTTKKSSQGSRKPAASADKSAPPPTRAKGSRTRLPGIGGTIAKPKGPKLRSAMLMGKGKAPTSRLGKPVKQEDGSFDVNGRPAKNMQDAMRVLKQQRAQEKESALSAQRITAQRQVDRQDLRQVELGAGTRSGNKYARTRAIDILFQKQRKASDKIKEVAQQGRSMQNEFNKLARKPSKVSAKRMEQLKTNMNRLRKSMDVLQKAERSYSERFKLQQRILAKSRKPKS